MPISRDEFQRIDGGSSGLDLSSETPLGSVYRFLLTHASHAFRQGEIIDAIERPQEEVESALTRLNQRGFVEYRSPFWVIADTEHAVASASLHGHATAADQDSGFSEEEVSTLMDTAVDTIGEGHHDVEEENERVLIGPPGDTPIVRLRVHPNATSRPKEMVVLAREGVQTKIRIRGRPL